MSCISRITLAYSLLNTNFYRTLGLVCINFVDAETLYRGDMFIWMALLAVHYDTWTFAVNCGEDDTFFGQNVLL